MKRYEFLVVETEYWKPDQDYIATIVSSLRERMKSGDIIVVSEKAISTATGNIVDETRVHSSLTAKLLARYWMKYIWGYFLGPLCHLSRETIDHFKNYPAKEGSNHKQVALRHSGLIQALMQSSEGGIDGTNLPYSYVSLSLKNANGAAESIRDSIGAMLVKDVAVMIVDTDKTYTWRNFHFTPRPNPLKGIHSIGGFLSYVIGRSSKLQKRATPLAIAGTSIDVEEALDVADQADRARGVGAGKTIWDMARAFKAPLTGVSWEMLETAEHKPIVIVRPLTRIST